MRPGKEYSLGCLAQMHDLNYYMIIYNDYDGICGYITPFSDFEQLKEAFLKAIDDNTDEDDDPYVGSQRKMYRYCANVGNGNRIEIEIGNLSKKQVRDLNRTFGKNE